MSGIYNNKPGTTRPNVPEPENHRRPIILSPYEQKLIQVIRELDWGEINKITVQNGQPMVIETKRTIKLNT